MSYSITSESDNIYVNINFPSPNIAYSSTLPFAVGSETFPMEYDITRNSDILSNPADYYCSIIRFDIPLHTIPNLICSVVPNTVSGAFPLGLPNLTTYIFGISHNGVDYPTQLIYVNTDNNNLSPPLQNQKYQIVTPYYYMYSFQSLINMVNVALNSSYINSGLAASNPGTSAPFFYFDPATQLLNLVVNDLFTTGSPLAEIFMNTSIIPFFNSLPAKSVNPIPQPNGKDNVFVLSPIVHPIIYAPIANSFVFAGAYPIMQYWNSSRRLIFTTNNIPIQKEYIPSLTSSPDENTMWPIITDFTLNLNGAGDNRSIAYYQPTSQYRLVDLLSNAPLRKINIKVYWQDIFGNYNPLLIYAGQTASLKIAFLKKSLYKGGSNLSKK